MKYFKAILIGETSYAIVFISEKCAHDADERINALYNDFLIDRIGVMKSHDLSSVTSEEFHTAIGESLTDLWYEIREAKTDKVIYSSYR